MFVYAPIGLLFEGASLLPQLVEKGKSQVTMARMIGQFAVTQGRGEAEKLAGSMQDQASSTSSARLGQSPAPPHPPRRAEAPAARGRARAGVGADRRSREPASTAPTGAAGAAIDVADASPSRTTTASRPRTS